MKKVVIIGAGFGGLAAARKLDKKQFQVTLIDKNNFHQFQPLLYQVAIAGIDAEAICFPIRGATANQAIKFVMATLTAIDPDKRQVITNAGDFQYDYLIIAAGTTTNYHGNTQIAHHSTPMKSAQDAITLRNKILSQLEQQAAKANPQPLNIVVVGGGATGVEIAGSLSELKAYVIPREFAELPAGNIKITLVEGSPKVLGAMSAKSSAYALKSLVKMGVEVRLSTLVTAYDGQKAVMKSAASGGASGGASEETIETPLLIWVSGVAAQKIDGVPESAIGPEGRIITDSNCRLISHPNIAAIGDIAIIQNADASFNKLPQVAPVAMQQAATVASNILKTEKELTLTEFRYKDSGSMATIGRNRAVADIGAIHLSGFIAWAAWLIIHLRSILGVRNKIVVLINWIWDYFSYRKSTGIIIAARRDEGAGDGV